MKKIVLDLEFTPIVNSKQLLKNGRKCEIIQIGAVKLDENDVIIDYFESLIKPEFTTIINRIEKLTHISQKDVEDKKSFCEVMDMFFDWIGGDTVEIYTWSMEDYKQLSGEARLKNYEDKRLDILFSDWKDLQEIFGVKMGVDRKLKLYDVISGSKLELIEPLHSAISDAMYTAKLLQIINDEKVFKEHFATTIELLQPKDEGYNVFEALLGKIYLIPSSTNTISFSLN